MTSSSEAGFETHGITLLAIGDIHLGNRSLAEYEKLAEEGVARAA